MSHKSPFATTTDWGIVRVGTGITVTDGIISTGGTPSPSLNYGFFYDTTTQTNPVANAANLVTLNTTGTANQVSVLGSQITVVNTGTYSKVFTLSFEKTTPGAPTIASIWMLKNGVNVPNSAQEISVPNQVSLLFVSGNYTLDLLAGDVISMAWSSPDTAVQLQFLAAAGILPATPSTKITLTRIS
jgi:hypothetical protein